MTQPAKSQEPSMEEILASIRRIIADDDASKTAQRPASPEPPKAAAPAPPPRPAPPVQPRAGACRPAEHRTSRHRPWRSSRRAGGRRRRSILRHSRSDRIDGDAGARRHGPAPQFRTIDGNFDISYEDEKPEPPRPAPEPTGRSTPASAATTAVSCCRARPAPRSIPHSIRSPRPCWCRTPARLEDLVREMLRPMLKAWLDDNLPGMVERMVRAEIERVSRGRMG